MGDKLSSGAGTRVLWGSGGKGGGALVLVKVPSGGRNF